MPPSTSQFGAPLGMGGMGAMGSSMRFVNASRSYVPPPQAQLQQAQAHKKEKEKAA